MPKTPVKVMIFAVNLPVNQNLDKLISNIYGRWNQSRMV
ncbi:hypothetical protein Cylst_3326 [Cylindrospermum stagnale PCC 7417]|uniref:Uncharacterized protein n=1 Tax=Cylindrospermum stagnale PCC 7417 TaxID=56107 RepID=K9WZ33_9NOST|nr:hypothetical protein Cylst_3326 [Cylindrospermum stagnale PCC 7417]